MTGRIPFGFLALLSALVCSPIQAQDQMGLPPQGGVQPTGFRSLQGAPYADPNYGVPGGYPQAAADCPPPGPPPPMVFQQLPDHQNFHDEDSPLGSFLTETFRHSFFRGEYLLWKMSSPGNVLLGAQPSTGVVPVNTVNPPNTIGYPGAVQLEPNLQFAKTVNGVTGIGIAPGLDSISFNNMNGFKGTFGVPTSAGQLELSAFILGRKSDSYFGGNTLASAYSNGGSIGIGTGWIQTAIAANPSTTVGGNVGLDGNPATNGQNAQFISQPVLVNGVNQVMTTTSAAINYDVSYQARLTTSAWGAEGNFFLNSPDPNSIIQLRPAFGVRYFNLQDKLNQNGQFNVANAADPTVSTINSRYINSAATNDLVGPQLGLRAEASNQWFQIGVEPKFTFGINSHRTTLDTSNVFTNSSRTDIDQSLLTKGTTFSPLFDVRFYSNVAFSKYVSGYVAYNYLWAGQVTRSYNDVVYNQNAAGLSDFKLLKNYSGVSLQGLSFGLEVKY